MQTPPGPAPGNLSPDGMWRWDGARWTPTFNSPPAMLGEAPVATGRTSRRSWLATAGGIAALAGVCAVAIGSILPFAHYSGDTSGYSADPSVFNGGYPGAWGDAAEPGVVMAIAMVAGIVLIASGSRMVRAFTSSALIVMGVQTLAMFISYAAVALANAQIEAGAIVGLLGALLLLAGGIVAATSLLLPERPAQQSSEV